LNFKALIQKNLKQLLFVFAAFFSMTLVSYFFVAGIVETQVFANTETIFQSTEAFVYSCIREAEVVLLNTVMEVQKKLNNGETPEDIQDYIMALTGWLVKPEHNVSGLMNIHGNILGMEIDGLGSRGGAGSRGYSGAREAATGIVRDVPRVDPQSGRAVVSISKPLEAGYGVISLTMDMTAITDYVTKIRLAEGGYGMLVNQDLVLIAHPNRDILDKPVADISQNHARAARELMAGKTQISAIRASGIQGITVILSFREIYTGWYVGIATPISSYYHPAYLMALVLGALGLVFMIILSCLLIRLSGEKIRSDEENKSKSSFLARMSHEIRTPMNSILGMAELIARKDISPEIDEYISIISQAGNTLLTIINDILDFSKITSGQFKIEPRQYRLASLIDETINVIRMRVSEKNLDLLVNVDGNIPAVLTGDDLRIRQILINLLNNAIKYTPQGSVALDIRYNALDDHNLELIISVKDTGIGIKPEDMQHLFSDFARLDMKSNQGIEGTGLGLAITHALCAAMNGRVTVSSEYGTGSTFTAVIKQTVEDNTRLAQVNNPQGKKVLLFEDRQAILRSINNNFINLGLLPFCAGTLPEFIAELGKGTYNYAFVSSRYALDCIYALGKGTSAVQLVIMVELWDISIFREVRSILMPIYSLPIANILNNVQEKESVKDTRRTFGFTAPAARVLIVDDISSNLRVAQELMSPYKMEVHTCLSGADAVERIKQERYDLVFMDHMMPGMDGLEAAAAIRAWEEETRINPASGESSGGRLPIVALTANTISGQREMFLENGMDDFLAKPIELPQLSTLLERWIPETKKIRTSPRAVPAEAGEKQPLRIDGLDTAMGLASVNGAETVYLDILTAFCRDLEGMIGRIREAREMGSDELFAQAMHALKGAARGVGALNLGDLAEELEKEARRGESGKVEQGAGDLLAAVHTLAQNIRAALSAVTALSEPRESTDISLLQLEPLKQALLNMDIETVNQILMEYLSIPMDSGTKERLGRIEEHILMFEYDRAVEKIDSLLSAGGDATPPR
jgi:signal transduction histidine kinase/CheY-like chemotaxis protein